MVHRATQQSTESIAHTVSVLNQAAGAAGSDFSKRPMVTWTPDETRKALEMVGVTDYQMTCLKTRGVLDGANLKLYLTHLGDPVNFLFNTSNEDLTEPQFSELLKKFPFAFTQPPEVPHKPDLSGASGKRTPDGVAMERRFKERLSGVDALVGQDPWGTTRCETREQYSDRIYGIKSDLLSCIKTMNFKTMADKNALVNLAVAHGLDPNSPNKYPENTQAAQLPVDQLPKTTTKGTEEFKETEKKQPPAEPIDLMLLISNLAKQARNAAKKDT
ncbi:MAG: hypothetical protein Q7T63_10085 [Burkholderiaceae bacterium]|nr:hypothetical protein [Burkholderiaceae bacterium]MDO9089703.1 hypothetical protein [Burkholderiaceae bacterium]